MNTEKIKNKDADCFAFYDMKGSFTLEAAVVVPIVMVILTAVVFLGIYAYDSVTIIAVSDYAVLACIESNGSTSGICNNAGSMLEAKLIGESGVSAQIRGDGSKMSVTAGANVILPLNMIRSLLGKNEGNISAEIKLTNLNGREVLILYKNIVDGVSSIISKYD